MKKSMKKLRLMTFSLLIRESSIIVISRMEAFIKDYKLLKLNQEVNKRNSKKIH